MRRLGLALLLGGLAAACGKKGPPVAPLYLVPSPVSEITAGRVEDRVRLRFALPTKNQNGPGIDLARVEIYAVTVAPGAETPPNRELMTKPYLSGQIEVEPPAAEGESTDAPPATAAKDERPSPGETVTFVEQLTPAILQPPARKPETGKPPAPPPLPVTTDPQTGLPVTPFAPKPGLPAIGSATGSEPVRVYVIRGVARNGRPGPPSPRVQIPLGSVPTSPKGLMARNAEHAVIVDWLPALASVGAKLPAYNIYRADAPHRPINATWLEAPAFEDAAAPIGEESCYQARTVDRTGAVSIEGELSEPACITRTDVFPPAPPRGLAAVSTPGVVQLIWNANTEKDLAGYVVLRADLPDETLRPLTPKPIRDTVFRDETAKPDVRYVYAIVAVDSATPPNSSAPSERAEAVGR